MKVEEQALAAACLLTGRLLRGEHIADVPAHGRPSDRADGYAVQALWAQALGAAVSGWKIAATPRRPTRDLCSSNAPARRS